MTDADFIAASVAHQFGAQGTHRLVMDDATRAQAMAASSGSALAWDHAAGAPRPWNGWHLAPGGAGADFAGVVCGERAVNRQKPVGALAALAAAGADFDLLIDMQDRRMRSLCLPDGRLHPVIGFNRLAGAPGRLLVPLPGYHDIGSPGFLGEPAPTAWDAKADRFAWRGMLSGRASPRSDVRREGTRLLPLLKRHARGEIGASETRAALLTFPRLRFVDRYLHDPRADVGLVDGNGVVLADTPVLAPYARPRMGQPAFGAFKYLVVLRGLDVGSSFFWTMNSGSLGLVMETPFDSFGSVHFRPWEHYVPFREDLSDFEDRLEWCAAHQPECRAMVAAASEVCRRLARADLRRAITEGLVDTLRAALR